MPVEGVNLPIIIQQAGSVSQVQENAQRVGEVQQMSASAEELERREKARNQVQHSDPSDAENRVRADGGGGGKGKERRAKPKPKKTKTSQPEPEPARPEGGLVDVTV